MTSSENKVKVDSATQRRKQIKLQKMLESRNIGKAYHGRSLSSYTPSKISSFNNKEKLLEVCNDNAVEYLDSGRGITFIGDNEDCYDLAILSIRALTIIAPQYRIRVIYFREMFEEDFEVGDDTDSFLILNFYPDSTIVSPVEYKSIEYKLQKMIDNNIPLFLHIPVEHSKDSHLHGDLINPVFYQKITKKNLKLEF